MRYLYSLLYYCLLPIIVLRMLVRSRAAPDYRRRLAERLGFFDAAALPKGRPTIWLHAVSVGETLAAAALVESLLQDHLDYTVVVTTTTPTGSERVRALFGERVFHVYAPWDVPGAVKRFLSHIRPSLLIIMETELWPNMLHHSDQIGCRIILANARLSERSARGYARLARLSESMLATIDTVACQNPTDGDRFLSLGLQARQLQITGSIKFDLELGANLRSQAIELREAWGVDKRSVIVAASTHPGEDELILRAFAAVRAIDDNCLLVIVPRHPERFDSVFELCVAGGWQVQRRSQGVVPTLQDDILLGDSMGELLLLLSGATVAVIGGSLVNHGGHNVLEAAAWGVPVVTGPYMFNFAEISELMSTAGAMEQLRQTHDLAPCLIQLLADPVRRRAMSVAGQRVVAENRGAKKRLLALIDDQLRPSINE